MMITTKTENVTLIAQSIPIYYKGQRNCFAEPLLKSLGFSAVSQTLRMYRGELPEISLTDVYGLACLELG